MELLAQGTSALAKDPRPLDYALNMDELAERGEDPKYAAYTLAAPAIIMPTYFSEEQATAMVARDMGMKDQELRDTPIQNM